jgi:predicted dehydrogenase
MKTIRIGVMGVGRGQSMINYAHTTQRAQLVAICDFWPQGLHNAQVTLKILRSPIMPTSTRSSNTTWMR